MKSNPIFEIITHAIRTGYEGDVSDLISKLSPDREDLDVELVELIKQEIDYVTRSNRTQMGFCLPGDIIPMSEDQLDELSMYMLNKGIVDTDIFDGDLSRVSLNTAKGLIDSLDKIIGSSLEKANSPAMRK